MAEVLTGDDAGELDPRGVGEKLSAMVAAEAAAAEAETPEPDEDEEGAEDEESAANIAIMEALGEYLGKVQAIMGENAPVSPCVFCHGFGFNSIELLPDSHSHRCEHCGGHGRVYTGSLVIGNETRACEECRGTGFATDSTLASVLPVEVEPEGPKILSQAEVEQIAAEARARVGASAA